MCFKKSHSELWFQRCLGCCRLTMTARSEDNIQKLVAGGSEAIIQQRDTDFTENEQETFLVVFSKYNEGWITAEELKLLPTHLLGKVKKNIFIFISWFFKFSQSGRLQYKEILEMIKTVNKNRDSSEIKTTVPRDDGRPATHLHHQGRDGYDKSTRKQNTSTTP